MKEENLKQLRGFAKEWRPYQGLCSCCDHEGETDDSAAGNRTNELYEMIQKIEEILR